jgi:hypothetical protein
MDRNHDPFKEEDQEEAQQEQEQDHVRCMASDEGLQAPVLIDCPFTDRLHLSRLLNR